MEYLPSDEDLKQMYVYDHHFEAGRSILVYPKVYDFQSIMDPFRLQKDGKEHYCQTAFLEILGEDGRLFNAIGKRLREAFL